MPRRDRNPYRMLAVFTSIIFLLPSMLLGGYFVGSFADERLGTEPYLTVLGLVLGGLGGFVQVFQILSRY
ncbi:MAG TPA: AtpZ/AtpI family protein [Acidobacteriota bacterium]|nr:AtpZ/AtpI family protein [Acidobacteriota bacterium]